MCGLFGIRAPERDVARVSYFGLFALQHRGQESAGIAVSDQGRLTVVRDMGLVAQVFSEQTLHGLDGQLAIGHTRYSTTGSTRWANAQPLVHHGRARTVALGHNGNLTNAEELREELEAEGVRLGSSSDSEVIAALIGNDPAPLAEAVAHTLERVDGATTAVALTEGKLVGFRDPYGFRPLVVGSLGDDWVLASESCALDLVGAEPVRELRPGELVVVDDELRTEQVAHPSQSLCLFEFIYLARPDSRLEGVEVYKAPGTDGRGARRGGAGRGRSGHAGARLRHAGRDRLRPRLRDPVQRGPDQEPLRRPDVHPAGPGPARAGIKLKFNPLDEVSGKRVVVVDDSIVRGTTMRQLVAMLFEGGATEVHVRVSSPPIVSPCFYGIDFGDDDQLVASNQTIEETRQEIGATTLAHLSLEGVQAATRRPDNEFCRACFTRKYPTRVPTGRTLAKLRFEPAAV